MDEHEKRIDRFKVLQKDVLDGLDQLSPVDREAYLARRASDVDELKDLRRALQQDLIEIVRRHHDGLPCGPVEGHANTDETPSGAMQRPAETSMRVVAWVEKAARLFMSREAFDLYVGPAIADIQHEYFTAVRNGREWLARWYVTRGVFWLLRPWAWAAIFAKVAAWWGRIS